MRGTRSLHVRLGALILGGVMPLLASAPALAQTAGTAHEVTGVAGYGAWDWISLTFRIAAVLVVIWGSVVAMRWYVRRMNGEAGGGLTRALHIVETRPLGPGRALHLVRLGDRAVLIGATPERINALMEIDDPAQLERLFAGGGEPALQGAPGLFAGLLTGLAMLPPLAARARTSIVARRAERTARRATDRAAALHAQETEAFLATTFEAEAPALAPSTQPPRSIARSAPRAARPAGVLTDVLARLGRRMRGGAKPAHAKTANAKPAPRVGMFGAPLGTEPAMTAMPPLPPALAALDAAIVGGASRAGSLFDRTLAEAQRVQSGGMFGTPLPDFDTPMFARQGSGLSAAGLRARAGYQQATPGEDEIAREARINELQRAIAMARRSAG